MSQLPNIENKEKEKLLESEESDTENDEIELEDDDSNKIKLEIFDENDENDENDEIELEDGPIIQSFTHQKRKKRQLYVPKKFFIINEEQNHSTPITTLASELKLTQKRVTSLVRQIEFQAKLIEQLKKTVDKLKKEIKKKDNLIFQLQTETTTDSSEYNQNIQNIVKLIDREAKEQKKRRCNIL